MVHVTIQYSMPVSHEVHQQICQDLAEVLLPGHVLVLAVVRVISLVPRRMLLVLYLLQ